MAGREPAYYAAKRYHGVQSSAIKPPGSVDFPEQSSLLLSLLLLSNHIVTMIIKRDWKIATASIAGSTRLEMVSTLESLQLNLTHATSATTLFVISLCSTVLVYSVKSIKVWICLEEFLRWLSARDS